MPGQTAVQLSIYVFSGLFVLCHPVWSRVEYPGKIQWRDQTIVVQVIDEPLRNWQLDVFRQKITPDSTGPQLPVVSAVGLGTAGLAIIRDSILLVSLRMCDSCPPNERILVPLWREVSPLDFGDQIGLVQQESVLRTVAIVEDSLMSIKIRQFIRNLTAFHIDVGPLEGRFGWDGFVVLGASGVRASITDANRCCVEIEWRAGDKPDNICLHLESRIQHGTKTRKCVFDDKHTVVKSRRK
ncbi:MAG: hypothetical protein HY851_07620 [candidate division Zixibacteria bacterium]|nr:hypothetical protein [candidate division Zixibacteria bacterium]